jgi:DNA-binding Lrp family transcriptional regulator
MNIRQIILNKIKKRGRVKTSDIIKLTNFSREYVNRFFRELRKEGKIILVGKANQAHYILADSKNIFKTKKNILNFNISLKNKNLFENDVLQRIKLETGIFLDLPKNIERILEYSFLEMLNNAIEHSESNIIKINMQREKNNINFFIRDLGMGIFKNIQKKKKLKDELEAVQDLLKGKQTTMPEKHSGQGIFFTSKLANEFYIKSSHRNLLFNNNIPDIFLFSENRIKGTKVVFFIDLNSKQNIKDVFDEYSSNDYEFDKTKIYIKLYKLDTDYISRSQARRLLVGLDKFKIIVLDFKNVETVGQAFADEIFRVWQNNHSKVKFKIVNSNESIDFMIKRAKI